MFRTKKSMLMVLTSGMLLQFGGCTGGYLSQFWRQTLLNIPVGFGRAVGETLNPATGLGTLLGTDGLTGLINTVLGTGG